MEVLSKFISKAVEGGFLKGWKVEGRGGEGVLSHLLFADDTLIFCSDNFEELSTLRSILLCFEAVSGLKMNLHKSELIPIGNIDEVDRKADELGCTVGRLPSTYLGLPLGAKFKAVRMWDPIIEKFDKRLAGWKARYLSKGGRLTLIKSTLSNLPIYYMSLFVLPASVRGKLERIMRRFLWSSGDEDKYLALVKWNRITLPRELGGLGIKSLDSMNKALLGKWIWRYGREEGGLWKEILNWRYGEERGGWCTQKVRGTFGTGVWKGILKSKQLVMNKVEFGVGNGDRIRFWHDKWCGGIELKESFMNLFNLSVDKDGMVATAMEWRGNMVVWAPSFRRNLREEEVGELARLLGALEKVSVRRGFGDCIVWKGGGREFSVKSLYKAISTREGGKFPVKAIWGKEIPPRVSFFAWTAYWERILTTDNLQVRGWCLVNRCYMCREVEETPSHLLLHCGFVRDVWSLIFTLFGISWVLPKSIALFVNSWVFPGLGGRKKILWRLAPLAVFWIIWKERNRRLFEDKEENVIKIKSKILGTVFEWVKVFGFDYSFEDFVDNLFLGY